MNWESLRPELLLAGLALALLLLDALFWPRRFTASLGYLCLCGCLIALSMELMDWRMLPEGGGGGGSLCVDHYAVFCDLLLLSGASLGLLLALHRGGMRGEYYPLFVLATLGMMLAVAAGDLMLIFIGLEIMSLSLYILAGVEWRSPVANEISLKLFFPWALAAGFFLYGTSLLYGATGSTRLSVLVESLSSNPDMELILPGLGLVCVGLLLKIGIVPFHMWVPDLFQGASSPVASFLALGARTVCCAVLVRILLATFGGAFESWSGPLTVLAVVSAVGGYLLALNQRDLKRLLGYTAIAHAGYFLLGLVLATPNGLEAALFQLIAHGLATVGVFAVLSVCHHGGGGVGAASQLNSYRGFGFRHPRLGLVMALSLLSLAGLPPTAGFMGRFYLLTAAIEGDQLVLAFCLGLSGLLGFYVYLRILVRIYRYGDGEQLAIGLTAEGMALLLLAGVGTFLLGVWPGPMIDVLRAAIIAIM